MNQVARRTFLTVPVGLAGLASPRRAAGLRRECHEPDRPVTRPRPQPLGRRLHPATTATTYADGNYQARGTYGGGPSYIGVDLTLQDSRITAVEVIPLAENSSSLGYQRDCAGAGAVPDAVKVPDRLARGADRVQPDRWAVAAAAVRSCARRPLRPTRGCGRRPRRPPGRASARTARPRRCLLAGS